MVKGRNNRDILQDVREVFGNWNIDNGSSFITHHPKDFDPQILEAFNVLKSAVKKN